VNAKLILTSAATVLVALFLYSKIQSYLP